MDGSTLIGVSNAGNVPRIYSHIFRQDGLGFICIINMRQQTYWSITPNVCIIHFLHNLVYYLQWIIYSVTSAEFFREYFFYFLHFWSYGFFAGAFPSFICLRLCLISNTVISGISSKPTFRSSRGVLLGFKILDL